MLISLSGWAAVLLSHLLALLHAPVVNVVVNVSVVCTIAVAVAVIVTVMSPLWAHVMTVVVVIDSVDMITRPIFHLPASTLPVIESACAVPDHRFCCFSCH